MWEDGYRRCQTSTATAPVRHGRGASDGRWAAEGATETRKHHDCGSRHVSSHLAWEMAVSTVARAASSHGESSLWRRDPRVPITSE